MVTLPSSEPKPNPPLTLANLLGSVSAFSKYNFLTLISRGGSVVGDETLAMALGGLNADPTYVLDFQSPITNILCRILAKVTELDPSNPIPADSQASDLIHARALPRVFGGQTFDNFRTELLELLPADYLAAATFRNILEVLLPAPESAFLIHNPQYPFTFATLLEHFPIPPAKVLHIILHTKTPESERTATNIKQIGTRLIIPVQDISDTELCVNAVAEALGL